jgi:hypothetical protein
MTRLEAEARMQYVPVAPEVVALMTTWVAPAPAGARMVDVCAGEGQAAAHMATVWGIGRDRLYLNELADGRMARCREYSDHVLGADAIRTLQAGRHMFQVAWTNPPFGHQPKEHGGGSRLEPLFFKRLTEEGMWLQPGGVHLMLAPQYVWQRSVAALNHLARCYDDLRLWALPAAHRAYDEVLVIGVVRNTVRTGDELRMRAAELAAALAHPALPELTAAPAPVYRIPAPDPRAKLIWRDLATATPEQAQTDLLTDGGAWTSRTYRKRHAAARSERTRIRPLFPLGKVAAALRIANGDINNTVIRLNDSEVRIKGGARPHVREWKEERVRSDGSTVVETHHLTTSVPLVVTMDTASGAITRYVGDAGIAKLMDQPEATQRLLDAVATSAPPVYAMQMPADVAAVLDRIVPVSGRALPGYQPGLIPMQRHIVAAIVEAFRQPDPHTRRPRRALGLSAEMGCGKSAMGTAAAEALRCILPTNPASRAFTVLVVAPNHLIGELAQVQAHDGWTPDAAKAGTGGKGGKGSKPTSTERPALPQWIAEWRDLLPHWHTTILETPAQVSAFYAAAHADPATPRVGFISFSKFSLGSGWEVAVTERPAMVPVRDGATESERRMMERRLAVYNAAKAQEQREWQALEAQRKHGKRAQQVVDADGEAKPTTRVYGPGVSERTIKRDLLFRCGTAFRETLPEGKYAPIWHWGDGVYCPDCGRRVLDKNGFPHTRASLKRAGMIACPFCGGMLGQLTRSQDNVGDRDLPIFHDPHFRDHHALECDPRTGAERRAIPWGERPRSNPRMALGDFIVQRGYAAVTDLVITDEFHAMKGLTSARGRIWGRLIEHAHRSIGLTGSPYGGKASTAYWLLQRMANPFVRADFGWTEEAAFVQRYGIVDTITTSVVEEEAQKLSGKRRASTRIEECNGITAELAAIMQSQFLFVLLSQMGFRLPKYEERVVSLALPPSLAYEYQRLATAGKEIIAKGGRDALSAYLQATLTYPLSPWQPVTIASTIVNMRYRAPEWRADTILPHHEWLAEHAMAQARQGRRMLVFVEHTQKLDLLDDLRAKIEQLSAEAGMPVKVAVLRSTTVKPGERAAWFAARERDGTNVVLCHPGLVETGLNLIGWPEIVFAEPTYSLYRAMQARKRAYRPTQTRDCNVTWLCYADTMIAQALDIIGSKATAATLLNGDTLSSGLLQIDPGMSILQELAKRVLDDRTPAVSAADLSARFATAGAALAEAMQVGQRDLVGVVATSEPTPALPAPVAIATSEDAAPVDAPLMPEPTTHATDPAPTLWRMVPAMLLLQRQRRGRKPFTRPNLPHPAPDATEADPAPDASADTDGVMQLAFF